MVAAVVALAVGIGAPVFALVPSALVIFYAERHGVRSPQAHLALGAAIGCCAALLYVLADRFFLRGIAQGALGAVIAVLCSTAGIAAGATYYAIAGRSAGRLTAAASVSALERGPEEIPS